MPANAVNCIKVSFPPRSAARALWASAGALLGLLARRLLGATAALVAPARPAAEHGGGCCSHPPQLATDRTPAGTQGEIHNVIASLRLGGASSIGLLADFKALHDGLCEVSSRTDIADIDTLSYFEPFLALVQSGQTSGVVTHVRCCTASEPHTRGACRAQREQSPVPQASARSTQPDPHALLPCTQVALSAINKFILYGFLALDAVQTAEVLNRTAAAASLVRFERIDRSIDEQVYLQICTTLLHCIICPAGKLLSDSAVWLCVKTCYEISILDELSPIVCRFAEDVLMQMVLSVFSNVSSMAGEEAGDMGTLRMPDKKVSLHS